VGDLLLVLIVILVLVLIWRGPRTLPRLGEALGRGVREARTQATRNLDDDPAAPRQSGSADVPPPDGEPRR
jgi:Sec-independent protein translocase protein TatA